MGDRKGKQTSTQNGASTQSSSLEELTILMQQKLGCPSLSVVRRPSIFKVHEKFQKVNTTAYTPELVSIGPYHHENETLKSMEYHKLRYASVVFSRKGTDLKKCIERMMELENDARECYSEHLSQVKSDEFVNMMLLDGLFIIVLFQKYAGEDERKGDPIFTNSWTISSLIRDLVLLENQIPLLVLHALFKLSSTTSSKFNYLALKFFENLVTPMFVSKINRHEEIHGSKHLLDLLGKSTFFSRKIGSPTTNTNPSTTNTNPSICAPFRIDINRWQCKGKKPTNLPCATELNRAGVKLKKHKPTNLPCATELNRAGVKFKKHKLTNLPCATELNRAGVKFKNASWDGSFSDISFRNNVLEIPTIPIQDQTEVLLRNLIAYEQSSDGNTNRTISYAFFMDNLIDSLEDVKFLCDAGIIANYLGDHQDVSNLFNKLLYEVNIGNNCHRVLYDEVNKYYNAPQHAWKASFIRIYFQNPWTIFSLLAAIVLLAFTTTQTAYAIKAYAQQKAESPKQG